MNKAHWDNKLGCYTCSFCDEPQGNYANFNKKTGEVIRFCKNHENDNNRNDR